MSLCSAKNELSEFWERSSSIFVSKLQELIMGTTPQIRNGALIDALLPYVRLSPLERKERRNGTHSSIQSFDKKTPLAKNELSEFWERSLSIFVSTLQGLIIVMTPQIRNGALIYVLLPYARLSSLGKNEGEMEPIAASSRLIRNSIRFVTQIADCFSCEAHEPPRRPREGGKWVFGWPKKWRKKSQMANVPEKRQKMKLIDKWKFIVTPDNKQQYSVPSS
ncbi:hypothetical protein CDAR_406461 [Caerostris darwini]|uniref:Uncharacterized protein n=1 Tax=Caerostris darwini TaxID=1538125 RepID=A0AAV4MPR1_9ARAC|nr:hypothetical protein CDAR_406461 [Caerostris darwini]